MEYRKDLLKQRQKSKLGIVIGILFFVVAVSWIPIRLLDKHSISVFDWLYSLGFFLNGVSQVMTGLGSSFERVIGKAFINIDGQSLQIKLSAFNREQLIRWSEIESIEYKTNCFIFSQSNAANFVFNLGRLEYSTTQEIKTIICEIAKRKNITVKKQP